MAPLRVPTSTVLNLQQLLSPSLFVRKRGNGQLSTTRRGEGAARREGARGARHGVAQAVPSVVVVLVFLLFVMLPGRLAIFTMVMF